MRRTYVSRQFIGSLVGSFLVPMTLTASLISALPSQVAAKAATKTNDTKKSKAGSLGKSSSKQSRKSVEARSKKSAAKTALDPKAFIAARAQKILTDLKSRPVKPTPTGEVTEVTSKAMKGPWLDSLYDRNLIEANWATEMLSDKRLFYEVLTRELGERASQVYPKTIGLREFLVQHKLVKANGEIMAPGEKIEEALHAEFPAGFVVRPAVGVAPTETGKGLFNEPDRFIVEILREGNALYHPSHMKKPVKSHILSAIASGEAVVLQENVVLAADARRPLKNRFFNETRIHTYEGRVVEGAVPTRWVQKDLLTDDDVKRAEVFVNDVLKALPLPLVNRQAWGVDVAVLDNGELKIIDIITNRGKRIAWSSYLEQPRVIGAYARHLENHYGLKFSGLSGTLIRHNFANYVPYWEKRIEKSPGGLDKALSYLPPIP